MGCFIQSQGGFDSFSNQYLLQYGAFSCPSYRRADVLEPPSNFAPSYASAKNLFQSSL